MSNSENSQSVGNQNTNPTELKRPRKTITESSPESSPETLKKLKSSPMDKTDMDRILDAIKGVKEQIEDEAKERKNEIADLKRMIQTDKEELMKTMKEDKEEWQQAINDMAAKMSKTEWRLNHLEKQQKRNNLVLTNYTPVATDSKKLAEEIQEMLRRKIEETVNVETVARIKTSVGEKLIIRMKCFDDKMSVLKKKKMIYEDCEGQKMPIYVDDDLTKEDREIQKKARDHCKIARELGKAAKVGYRKVFINGKEHKWNQENNNFGDK